MTARGIVMVVDDTPSALALLTALLTAEGYDVRPADSGALALASVAASAPDLILLDIRMPGMGGFEVFRRLSEREDSRDIPVMFVSASTENAERLEGLTLGAVDYVTKPVHREELLARVKTHLELHRLRVQFAQQADDLRRANDQLQVDLAERTHAETQLASHAALLTALINSPTDTLIFAIDRRYRYTAFNERHREEMRRVWHVDIQAGMCLLDVMQVAALRDLARQSIDRAMRGEAFTEVQHQPDPSVDYELHWAPIRLNDEVVGVTALIRDITDRVAAVAALSQAQAHLERRVTERTAELQAAKRLLDQTGRLAKVGGWELDLVNQKLDWTDEVYRIHEVEPGREIALKDGIAFYAPEAVPVITEAVRRATEEGVPYDVELPFITARHNRRWVRAVGEPRWVGGAVVKIGGVFQDITERRRIDDELKRHRDHLEDLVRVRTGELAAAVQEVNRLNAGLEQRVADRTAQLATANKDLEAFSYSVSHDLRAPLRAIDGFARILTDEHGDSLTAEGRRVLAVISDEAARMGQLIDDLLAFSKLGRQPMFLTPLDVGTLARAVFDECVARTPGRTVHLHLQPLPMAHGDRAMIRRVLVNLVSNALKFTSTRDVATIAIEGRIIDEHEALYSVRDNGVGFDMRYAGKLFGVFQRLHSDLEFEGTGVGLALAQRIIQRHGGRIWAEGHIDEGAVFHFALPRNDTNDGYTD